MNVLTPPKPPSGKAADDGPLIGRALVSKLSLAQKASDEKGAQDAANDMLSALAHLRMVVSRRGLLRGDTSRAEAFLIKLSEASSNGGGSGVGQNDGGGGKRRKKGGGGGGGALSNKAANFVDGSPSHVGNGILDDEVLLLIGLGRILGAGKSAATAKTLPDGVVQEAAEVLLGICRHVTTYSSSGSSCINAECELLLVACPQLLSGLGNMSSHLLESGSMDALASCHRAASSIIIFMGTRLSRSKTTIEKIVSTATEAIFNFGGDSTQTKHCIQSAAVVLAAQPLAGNSDGTSPGILWTNAIVKATKSLTLVMSIFFPMHKSSSKARQYVDSNDQAWVDLIDKSMTSQEDRTIEFLRRIEGYFSILKSLLDLEGCDGSPTEGWVSCASIPLAGLLDLIELMLAFPSAAEARYLSTKSKLRDISIEHGVLSPSSAMVVANSVKSYGLNLFDRIISSVNSSSIVHGRLIMRLASSSLHSSCSYALKRSIDPIGTPAVRTDGKRGRRWLHDSLRLRRMSIRAFGNAMVRIGPSIALSAEPGSLFAESLVFVSGCLLEQTIAHDASPEADWGTLSDRIGLACECAKVLECALSVAGPYLDGNTRSTIESVAGTCLSNLSGQSTSSITGPALSYSSTKCSLLKLASSSICAPWSDGAGSSLVGLLRRAAESLKRDNDGEVAAAAYSAICLCDAITAPRAPPMVIVSRNCGMDDGYAHATHERKPTRSAVTSSDILGGIEAAKKELQAATATRLPKIELLDEATSRLGEKRKAKSAPKPTDIEPKATEDREAKKQKKEESRPKESEPEGTVMASSNHFEASVERTIEEEEFCNDETDSSVKDEEPESTGKDNADSSLDKKESTSRPSSTAAPASSLAKIGGNDSDSDSLGEIPGIVMAGPDDEDM